MPAMTGLDMFYYAILQKDDATGVAYSAPANLPIAIQVDKKPKNSTAVLYGDNKPVESATVTGEIEVTINIGDLDLPTRAVLLGHSYSGGVLTPKSTDVAPYVAFGWRAKKTNGKYRYYWLTKGRFEVPDQTNKTTEDKIDFQTAKLTGKFLMRTFDSTYEKVADEDDPNYLSSIGQNWFTAVETGDSTPPVVSTVVPANNATAVAVGSPVVWTFNEALSFSTIIPANFILQKADASAQVSGTLSVDATRKVVTFTPSANLSAATQYMAIVTTGVKDLFGNALVATSVTKFTTA